MDVTEQISSETIQTLEIAVADLENRLSHIKSVLSQQDMTAEDRIAMVLNSYRWHIFITEAVKSASAAGGAFTSFQSTVYLSVCPFFRVMVHKNIIDMAGI